MRLETHFDRRLSLRQLRWHGVIDIKKSLTIFAEERFCRDFLTVDDDVKNSISRFGTPVSHGELVRRARGDFQIECEVAAAGLDTPLGNGDSITYTRVDRKAVAKTKKVAFETSYQDTKKLDEGETEVKTKGEDGVRTTVYTEVRHDGRLESRKKTSSTITTEPRTKVVLRGTRETKSVLDGGRAPDVGNGGGQRSSVFVTGYTYWDNSPPGSAQIARPIIHDRAGGTGTWRDPITVAVGFGPRFPFGTKFYLPELKKYFIVEDLCGACSDGRSGGEYTLDIWLDGSDTSSGRATSCAASITGVQPAIKDPDKNLPVDSGSVC